MLSSLLSSDSSLQPEALRIGDYIDRKLSDLNKAKLALELLKNMAVRVSVGLGRYLYELDLYISDLKSAETLLCKGT